MRNIIILLVALIGISAQAQDTRGEAELSGAKKNKNAKYTFEVNGNCEQCKKRIEKAAYSVSGVKMAIWDVESHKLNVILNEEKASVADVKQAIAKVGHDTDIYKATDEAYMNLHSCCQYERAKR